MRRMMPATTAESSGRSTPAIPRQIAAGTIAAIADRLVHHVVQHLLDLQLAGRLQVGAAGARLGDERAVLVRELTDRLRAARIDAEDVNHDQDAGRQLHQNAQSTWLATVDA